MLIGESCGFMVVDRLEREGEDVVGGFRGDRLFEMSGRFEWECRFYILVL